MRGQTEREGKMHTHTHTHTHTQAADLQANSDGFGEGAFRQHCLHLRHYSGGQNATFIANHCCFLLHPCHQRKVLGKVCGQDASDAFLLQVLFWLQLCWVRKVEVLCFTSGTYQEDLKIQTCQSNMNKC